MTDASTPGRSDAPRRDDEDEDYDLLTFDEAGVRLVEEIKRQSDRLAQVEQSEDAVVSKDEIMAIRSRLDALRAAAQRNARRSLDADQFEDFFGYRPGDPRRHI